MVETKSRTFVADGSNDMLDGFQAGSGNLFYALNAPGIRNATLIGSGTGNDKFAVESIAGGANLPHQITIENFHQGDALFLENYSATDEQRLIQAAANGGSSFILSDNTTVSFVGGHPTGAFNGGTIAI